MHACMPRSPARMRALTCTQVYECMRALALTDAEKCVHEGAGGHCVDMCLDMSIDMCIDMRLHEEAGGQSLADVEVVVL